MTATPPARERQLELKFQQMRDNPEQYFEKARKEAQRKVRGRKSAIRQGAGGGLMKRAAAVTLLVLGVIAVAALAVASIWTGDNRWIQTAGIVFLLTICTATLSLPVLMAGDQ